MKRIFTILSIALVCGALSCPSIDARGRQNGNTSTQQHAPAQNAQRPGNNTTRPGNSGNGNATTRPGNNNTRPGNSGNGNATVRPGNNNTRPGNSGNGNATTRPGGGNTNPGGVMTRPGNNAVNNNSRPGNTGAVKPGNNFAPGGGHQPSHQPGNQPVPGGGHQPSHQPGHQPVPGGGHQPSHQPGHQPVPGNNFGPGHGPQRPYHDFGMIPPRAPYRPMLPPPAPWTRPVPPPAFRPGPRYPVISTILGITLGTAINLTLNQLFNDGYYISGYTNDAIYLNDVRQLNMLWPNATLYYNGGRLAGSDFVYSTPYYDTNRYYTTYNSLVNAYGLPVSQTNLPGGGFSSSWFGYDGQYVTLQFSLATAANGSARYFTTLSFGN